MKKPADFFNLVKELFIHKRFIMLIELAYYTILFAVTAVGLQTLLLCPTLWSGGSAVAIKLGFRGTCFAITLLFIIFLILLTRFLSCDFSLAIVFENFDSQSGLLYALPAFCFSREGFFFTFIIIMSVALLTNFSKKDLATYQERGRYLFAGGFFILFLLVLMLITANPFVRIDTPPFEGNGLNPEYKPLYKLLSILSYFSACACLTFSFIKTVCMYSKGRQFVFPALSNSLLAALLLVFCIGLELLCGWTTASNTTIWQWTIPNSLTLSILLLTVGQIILLFLCRRTRLFTNWILVFSLFAAVFANAGFLASEYKLFTISAREVYFPNPITALSALFGVICFLLFLCSVTLKKPFKENTMTLFCQESFFGISAAILLAAGTGIGILSYLPALFVFFPDLPVTALPALFTKTVFRTLLFASIFFFIASKRISLTDGWKECKSKNILLFLSGVFLFCCMCFNLPEGNQVILYVLPAILVLGSVIGEKELILPRNKQEVLLFLKSVPLFKYGAVFCAIGFFIFSFSLSHTVLNKEETVKTIKLQELTTNSVPCSIETLSGKSETFNKNYRLLCQSGFKNLTGNLTFQWPEKPLKTRLLQISLFSTRLFRLEQTQKESVRIFTTNYPALRTIGSGVLLICAGIVFLLISVKKEKCP